MSENKLSQEEVNKWIKSEEAKLFNYLARNNMQLTGIEPSSRLFPRQMVLWQVNTKDHGKQWVLTGELPSDHLAAEKIPDERAALRNFSLSWQLKAEKIMARQAEQTNSSTQKEQSDYANLLVTWAERLYQLNEMDSVWA